MKVFKELLPYLIIVVVVILIRCFLIEPVRVNGESMIPTLEDGQTLILNKIVYKVSDIKRFDIVVLDTDKYNELLIKRVVGLPGEHVSYKDGNLYINGKKVKEDFKHENTDDFDLEELDVKTIPEDKYFVVGDNRVNSQDSRIIGLVDKKDIEGRVRLSFFPFNKFGLLN